ncbi:hypothetical protein D3C73_1483050 [compost metagenome]
MQGLHLVPHRVRHARQRLRQRAIITWLIPPQALTDQRMLIKARRNRYAPRHIVERVLVAHHAMPARAFQLRLHARHQRVLIRVALQQTGIQAA